MVSVESLNEEVSSEWSRFQAKEVAGASADLFQLSRKVLSLLEPVEQMNGNKACGDDCTRSSFSSSRASSGLLARLSLSSVRASFSKSRYSASAAPSASPPRSSKSAKHQQSGASLILEPISTAPSASGDQDDELDSILFGEPGRRPNSASVASSDRANDHRNSNSPSVSKSSDRTSLRSRLSRRMSSARDSLTSVTSSVATGVASRRSSVGGRLRGVTKRCSRSRSGSRSGSGISSTSPANSEHARAHSDEDEDEQEVDLDIQQYW